MRPESRRGSRIAQTPFVVLEDVVARKAEQQEFLGRDVAVDRDVGGSGHRVRAVETVQTGDEEAQTEADVGRVVGTGGEAPVDLFLERAVHVRAAVVVDDPADEALALGGRRERCRVGGWAARRSRPRRSGTEPPESKENCLSRCRWFGPLS